MRLATPFCLLISASILLPTQAALACTFEASVSTARSLDRERNKRIKVEGTLRVDRFFTIARPSDFNKEAIVEETWHFGTLESEKGRVYETYHETDNLIVLCGRAQGPVRDATGVFYLEKNRETGNFYIYDWEGDYLPVDTAEN